MMNIPISEEDACGIVLLKRARLEVWRCPKRMSGGMTHQALRQGRQKNVLIRLFGHLKPRLYQRLPAPHSFPRATVGSLE
jgi:hypothetical protein